MADKTIGELPAASGLDDDSLLVVEQQGTAMRASGALWKGFAQSAVASQVSAAQHSAQAAASSAQVAQAAQRSAQAAQAGAEMAERAIENMTVSADTLSADSPAKVTKSASGASFHLFFGIQGIQGPQGPQGIQGPSGPQGINGVAVAAEGQYAFNVDSNGHLILFYEGNTTPDFSIGANGHLYYNFEEATVNATT